MVSKGVDSSRAFETQNVCAKTVPGTERAELLHPLHSVGLTADLVVGGDAFWALPQLLLAVREHAVVHARAEPEGASK